jgi:hypothetical protein
MTLVVLFLLLLQGQSDYDRSEWQHWIDADGDCQDTRQEVLIEEGKNIVLDEAGCRVVSGLWIDPYTGETFTDPTKLDVDHMVPLAEAHRSGGYAWTLEQKRDYANDLDHPEHLIAVKAGVNRSKGDKDPVQWMPPNKDYWCQYVADWQTVKQRYNLSYDAQETIELVAINTTCLEEHFETQSK